MRTSAVAGRFGLLGFFAFVGIGPLLAPSDAAAQSCMVTTPIGPINDVGTGVAIQPDGKILLSGYASNGINDDFAIVRYNPDFTLDLSFGTGGKVTTPIGSAQDRAEAIAVQSDGKIVVAGHKNSGGGNNDFAIVRYNIDGSLDTSFNPGGVFGGPPNLAGMVVTAITGGNDEIESLAIQADGKIVVAGFTQRATLDYVAARYNPDGSLDTAGFNSPNGYTISTNGASNDVANAVAIQPSDGKIVLAGWAFTGVNEDFAIVRLNTDGTFDGAFGNVLVNFPPNNNDRAHTVIVQPDDKILVAGEVRDGSGFATFGAARRNPDGSPDGILQDFVMSEGLADHAPARIVSGSQVTGNSRTDAATGRRISCVVDAGVCPQSYPLIQCSRARGAGMNLACY